jgi:hypothetical protein
MRPLTKPNAVKSARTLIAASTCLAASLMSGVTLFADDAEWFFDGHHFSIALDDLTPGVTLINSNGSSNEQEESPYITVVDSNSSLAAGDSASVTLQLKVPDLDGFAYDVREVFQQ